MSRRSGRRVAMVVYNDLMHDARVHKEAQTLIAAGYAVEVIGMRDSRTPPLVGWEGVPVTRLHVGPARSLRLRYARFWADVYRLLTARRPEAIHAHDLDTLAPCWLTARRLDVPLVHDAHELWTELPSLVGRPAIRSVWSALATLLVPRCDAVITVGEGVAAVLAERYGIAPCVVRNLPPRRDAPVAAPVRERVGLGPDAPLLIFQGGLLPGLGIDRAIRMMESLPDAHLVIVGDGPLGGALREQAAASPAASRITFLAAVPFAELPPITAAADVGLFLGESEGLNLRLALPNKLFEYIAAGVPVVATDWPEIGSVVRHWEVGTLLAPGSSPEEAARAVREALAGRERFAANARRAAQELAWEADAPRLIECYARLPWRS